VAPFLMIAAGALGCLHLDWCSDASLATFGCHHGLIWQPIHRVSLLRLLALRCHVVYLSLPVRVIREGGFMLGRSMNKVGLMLLPGE
jgi:hypothetical protein